jgi:hypothetical protein
MRFKLRTLFLLLSAAAVVSFGFVSLGTTGAIASALLVVTVFIGLKSVSLALRVRRYANRYAVIACYGLGAVALGALGYFLGLFSTLWIHS